MSESPVPRIRQLWCWLWYGHEWVRENAGSTNQMCFRCGRKKRGHDA